MSSNHLELSLMPEEIPENEIIPLVRTGPPAKYSVDMCDTIVGVAAKGGHIPAMMLSIGIGSRETWYRWRKAYPEFDEAVQMAEIVSQAYYEKIGLMGMTGQIEKFNATTHAMIMNNKFKEEYSRSGTGGSHTEITVNQVNLSSDEMLQKIAQKLEKFKSLGVDLLEKKNAIEPD